MHLPFVTLFGQVDHPGAIIRLVPPIPAIEVGEHLVALRDEYTAVVDEHGVFAVTVLATNVGVDSPWMYTIDAGGKSARVALPYGIGPISFNELMAKQ